MSGQLKEVRERIRSVKSTQQITRAMKMVSAAKLRKATDAIVQMRPYADKQNEILKNILSNLDGDAISTFGVEREVEKALMIVGTSNRGLLGAFNANVIKAAEATIGEKYSEVRKNGGLSFLCIGKKGRDYFRRNYPDCELIQDYVNLFQDLSFDSIVEVPNVIMDAFADKKYDAVDAAYGRFKNAGMQFPESVQYLPVPKEEEIPGKRRTPRGLYLRARSKIASGASGTSILQTQFYKFLLDTHASEHGARMTAMDKATENAEELVKELKIMYNKARQAAITTELSEIVSGAAALEGA